MAEVVALPSGWAQVGDGSPDVLRARHRQLDMSLVVQARTVDTGCDPRGVAALLAARLAAAAGDDDSEVEFRGWGRFGEREVALQVLRVGGRALLHAVWLDDSEGRRCVVAVGAAPHTAASEAGSAFAAAIAELSAGPR
jgi:hypothetical protein